ncbi:S-methyl-5-thioribose-1-phosphate isomerase [Testudinibacter aquarius]|uniref:Methylthioribose-1-phosphate isomerase n=1 Tax=Testudinibacter aquarius TaxID=1524974 RepID=A0A4R3YA10_9PAST|nr:S-methyl-5-thioribose-1-phosphate isomerase [Testudinibacter aquarius]KAE9528335.1 S-methyl-5-thioribose-1-phosphate isomerase [Testudinibacter aquarius]TCV88827.1 methylthioribose-1-phosphate isomerase [Testudinibacter aquarius]TNG88491.1 S-methyl-5-thioribose-1-phosphate isomerase [Testudinibacter aquarius]
MKINGKYYRTIWLSNDGRSIEIIDQTKLPFKFEILRLSTIEEVANAIKNMNVRGAPLIGVTAAYGMAIAMHTDYSDRNIDKSYKLLLNTRPTAINLKWALDRCVANLKVIPKDQRVNKAYALAEIIANEDVEICQVIGSYGLKEIERILEKKQDKSIINILTHCNAGWLATVDWGTALSPIYMAHEAGINVHVWVDETRPRNQGGLTAFELGAHGVPHTLIADNIGGHLMQHGLVDLCIVGTDRTTARGDVCNKIGTYLKALAAKDNNVPFYVALPSPSIDFTVHNGIKEIPIEERSGEEQSHVYGIDKNNELSWVNTVPKGTECGNYAFDVTPAELITGGLITEYGIYEASERGLNQLTAGKKLKAVHDG